MAERSMGRGHSYELGEGVDYTSSIRLEIPREQKLKRAEIIERLSRRAVELANPHMPIIGAIVGSGERTQRRQVVLGLDPSRNWGTPSVRENRELADYIAQREQWRESHENMPALRVPLGRRREYDTSNDIFSVRAVRPLFQAQGRAALTLVAADLFSIRFNPKTGKVQEYDEPGVLVDANASQLASGVLEDVLEVAEAMDQDRLVPAITGKRTQVYQRQKDGS